MSTFDKSQMDAMVNRFLGWKLPPTFGPDAGVKFTPANGMSREEAYAKGWWPVGTNLLTADEARAMLEHILEVTFLPEWSLLEATQASHREHMKLAKGLRDALAELVAVKGIKERAAALHFAGPSGPLGDGWETEWKRLQREYIERQPKAWAAAQAALDASSVLPSSNDQQEKPHG